VLNLRFCSLKSESNCNKKKARISWSYWFKKALYYQVALLYMLARLITNVSQVGTMCSRKNKLMLLINMEKNAHGTLSADVISYAYFFLHLQSLIAFYVTRDLRMNEYSKAIVSCFNAFLQLGHRSQLLLMIITVYYALSFLSQPLFSLLQIPAIIFCCSFLVSVVLQVQPLRQTRHKLTHCGLHLTLLELCVSLQEIKWNSRRLKSLLTIGATLWVISGVAVFLLPSQMSNLMYPLAVVIGAANAFVMVTVRKFAPSSDTMLLLPVIQWLTRRVLMSRSRRLAWRARWSGRT
jgi:hypothetical protein